MFNNAMMKQAKKMQEKMQEVKENLKNVEVEGVSGGNIVKVILKGDYEMKSISIDQSAKKEKDEIINDLIVAAYNDAKDKLKKKTSEEIAKVTGMPNMPFDIKLPF